MRLGRDDFEVDPEQQQEATERYDDGRGLIGGDPNRRPDHIRWRPIPEAADYLRLIDVSGEKRALLEEFLHGKGNEGKEGNDGQRVRGAEGQKSKGSDRIGVAWTENLEYRRRTSHERQNAAQSPRP